MATFRTVAEFQAYMQERIQALAGNTEAVYLAASDLLAAMDERIFTEGKNSLGVQIGAYNAVKALYVNPNALPKNVPAAGKGGQTKFKSGKDHKTAYFPSYKDLRTNQGRPTEFVNLNFTGMLERDVATSLTQTSKGYMAQCKNLDNLKKIRSIETKYGEVFKPTKEEAEHLKEVLLFEIKKRL